MTKTEQLKAWNALCRLRYLLTNPNLTNPNVIQTIELGIEDAARLIYTNQLSKKIAAQFRLEILSIKHIWISKKSEDKDFNTDFDIFKMSEDEICGLVQKLEIESLKIYRWGRFIEIEKEIKRKKKIRQIVAFIKKFVKR